MDCDRIRSRKMGLVAKVQIGSRLDRIGSKMSRSDWNAFVPEISNSISSSTSTATPSIPIASNSISISLSILISTPTDLCIYLIIFLSIYLYLSIHLSIIRKGRVLRTQPGLPLQPRCPEVQKFKHQSHCLQFYLNKFS